MNDRFLRIYLKDHAALGLGQIELARRILRRKPADPMRKTLEEFLVDMRLELDAVSEVLRRLGSRPSLVKQGVAKVSERLGRLKLNGRLIRPSPLHGLTELEGLSLLAESQEAVFRTLRHLQEVSPHFRDLSFAEYEERARVRRKRLEAMRLLAAERAFAA